MKIIGLTGGSGTGKSTVAARFATHGAGVVDADAVYRTLCSTCQPMLRALRDVWGARIFTDDGALCRPALAEIVFHDAAKLAQLTQITTPYIRTACQQAFAALSACPLILYDAPTLYQSGTHTLCHAVIGVLAPLDLRIQRIVQRDALTPAAARARVLAQPDDAFYYARCQHIITNNNGLHALTQSVDTLYHQLIGGISL